MKTLIRIGANVLAVWLTFTFVSGLHWNGEWLALGLIAVIIGLVNALIKPIAKALAMPIRFATLGLFTLVINVVLMGGVIYVADRMDLGVTSDNWQSTLLGGLALAVVSAIASAVID
jgi:putative membrane protein